MTGTEERIFEKLMMITDEYYRGLKKHNWQNYSLLDKVAKHAGEAGEALREANHIHEGRGDIDKLKMELIQSAATAIRCLINLPK